MFCLKILIFFMSADVFINMIVLTCGIVRMILLDGDGKSGASAVKNGGAGCHYHTLGVDSSSSERQIKVAYRKLALKFHPDKNKEDGAEDQFKAITSAYSVIVDKSTRDQYDRERRGSSRSMW